MGKRIDQKGGGFNDSRKYAYFRPYLYLLLLFENFELLVCENKGNLREIFEQTLNFLL